MLYKYSWRVSLVVLGAAVVLLLLLGPIALGGVSASLLDVRFIILLALGSGGLGYLGPAVLSVLVAAVRAAYLQIVLPPIWERLEIPPYSFWQLFWPAAVAALIVYSLAHCIIGWRRDGQKLP